MDLHAELDVAGKQNDEARQDASAARFAAITCVAHMHSCLMPLLGPLFTGASPRNNLMACCTDQYTSSFCGAPRMVVSRLRDVL